MERTGARTDQRQSTMQVRPLAAFGAEVSGVDLTNLDDASFNDLRASLHEHQVLVLRNQDISVDHQRAFGQRFGELLIHPFSPNMADKPEVIVLNYDADNKPALTDQWHADETYRECPPAVTILRANVVPDAGGDTMFASMTRAYDRLSDRMKAHLTGLVAEHDFLPFRRLFGNDPSSKERLRELEDAYPKQWHPVIREHPATGKLTLYVNPQFVTRIIGLPPEESATLLPYRFDQARVPENQLRVHWEPDTVVLWDNASVLHYAIHDYYPQHRSMFRVTVGGTRPQGPIDDSLLPAEAAAPGYGTGDASNGGGVMRQFRRQ